MKLKLFVRKDIGKGDPLVLLHGMFGDGSQWEQISAILSKDFRVIVVDLLGHGRSPRPTKAKYTDKEHAKALRNTLESLHATENLTVVGYSMGGAVALSYTSFFPRGVRQLYLISTPFYLKPDEMIPNKYAGSIIFTKVSTGFYGLIDRWMHRGGTADKVVRFSNDSAKFHAMIGANDNVLDTDIIRMNIKNLVSTFDFVGHLKKLETPLTFYAGKKDIFVVQPQLNALRQYQPYMDIQRLDVIKIDHMLVQNLPKEIAKLIKKNAAKTLHVAVDKGKGEPLVLLHGIESSSHYWDPFIKPLSEKNRVIAIDLLGFGDSPKPLNIPYSLDNQVERLEQTIAQLGIEKFEVVAHSLGSLVAIAYAAKHPKQITSMTLLAPVFVPHSRHSDTSPIVKRLDTLERLAGNSYLYAHIANAIGYARLSKYLPSLRSVKNSVHEQRIEPLLKKARHIPTSIFYGSKDKFIDTAFMQEITKKFHHITVNELPRQRHNFALFEPQETLRSIRPGVTFRTKAGKATVVPPAIGKQIVKLAIPVLMAKSLLYIAAGILLFTTFAPAVITIGLGIYFFSLGHAYIRGAFSLKNEKLSYFWYVMLGLGIIAFGLFVLLNPQYALKISAFVLFGIVLLAGLSRLVVGLVWATQKSVKTTLLITGTFLALAGALALAGGDVSIKLIVYGLGIALVLRGVRFGVYALIAIFFAYIRGFGK